VTCWIGSLSLQSNSMVVPRANACMDVAESGPWTSVRRIAVRVGRATRKADPALISLAIPDSGWKRHAV
jgi:hypothetical protein